MSETIGTKFKKFFLSENGRQLLDEKAVEEGLNNYFRPIAWKIFFNIIPEKASEEWKTTIQAHRQRYRDLRKKHWENKEKISPKKKFIDPLAPPCEDPEVKMNQDILLRINKDVDRLFNDIEYFKEKDLREIIVRMCYVYAKDHVDKNYQQGFHEFLGVFYYCYANDNMLRYININTDVVDLEEPYKSICLEMFNPDCIEEDTYLTFEYLMKDLGYLFEYKDNRRNDNNSKIFQKCEQIFEQLGHYDSQYHAVLHKHEVLGIFGVKWLKMIFAREFRLSESIKVWDGIFSFGNKLKLCDGFFLSMLHEVREEIMSNPDDYLFVMKRFTQFPEIEDVIPLMQRAIDIEHGKYPIESKIQPVQQNAPVKTPSPNPQNQQQQTQQQEHKPTSLHGKISSFFQNAKFGSSKKNDQVNTIAVHVTPETQQLSGSDAPSWMSNAYWGENASSRQEKQQKPHHQPKPVQKPQPKVDEKEKEKKRNAEEHEQLKNIMTQLENEYKKESIDKKQLKVIMQQLGKFIDGDKEE